MTSSSWSFWRRPQGPPFTFRLNHGRRRRTTTTDHKTTTPNAPLTKQSPQLARLVLSALAFTLTLTLTPTPIAPIRPVDAVTLVVRPLPKSATLVPGQPLHFECTQIGVQNAQFIWYKRNLVQPGPNTTNKESQQELASGIELQLLEPNQDDSIEIHNERLTLLKPNYQSVGDYICRALNEDKTENEHEFETIQVRAQPWVEDFGLESASHTGKSATLTDGERLELLCRVRDESVPVNITWMISRAPDNDWDMVQVPEYDPSQLAQQTTTPSLANDPLSVPTYTALSSVMVERVSDFAKRLVVPQLGPEHRGYYTCIVDNRVTDKTRKTIYIRVKDRIVALWPFLGILAELFILFTIIYVWETQKAQRSLSDASKQAPPPVSGATTPSKAVAGSAASKRPVSGPSSAFESVPLRDGQ